jgi:hypothetical protein
MYAPVVTEKYVVSLIMESHNSATTKIGVLWEKRLYHPESGKIMNMDVLHTREAPLHIKEKGNEVHPFLQEKSTSSKITFQYDCQGVS